MNIFNIRKRLALDETDVQWQTGGVSGHEE